MDAGLAVNFIAWSVFMIMIGFAIGVSVGRWLGIKDMGDDAIEKGVAEWKIDPKTGEKAFTWKSVPPRRSWLR